MEVLACFKVRYLYFLSSFLVNTLVFCYPLRGCTYLNKPAAGSCRFIKYIWTFVDTKRKRIYKLIRLIRAHYSRTITKISLRLYNWKMYRNTPCSKEVDSRKDYCKCSTRSATGLKISWHQQKFYNQIPYYSLIRKLKRK